jgi:hypothetical protein
MMGVLEHRRAQAFATVQRIAYASLLRRLLSYRSEASSGRSAESTAAHCYYQLGMYRRWARVESHLGIATPYRIDAKIPWDGINTNFLGMEYRLICKEHAELLR